MTRRESHSHRARAKAAADERRAIAKAINELPKAGKTKAEKRARRNAERVRPEDNPAGCRKVGYRNEGAASAALVWLSVHSRADRVPQRSYACPKCGLLHLTSQNEGDRRHERH